MVICVSLAFVQSLLLLLCSDSSLWLRVLTLIQCTNYSTVAWCGSVSARATLPNMQSVTSCSWNIGQTLKPAESFTLPYLDKTGISKYFQHHLAPTIHYIVVLERNKSAIRNSAGYLMCAHSEMKLSLVVSPKGSRALKGSDMEMAVDYLYFTVA